MKGWGSVCTVPYTGQVVQQLLGKVMLIGTTVVSVARPLSVAFDRISGQVSGNWSAVVRHHRQSPKKGQGWRLAQ